MRTKTLQQTVTFKASPREVYDMLMDTKKHQSLSGQPAKNQPQGRWGIHSVGLSHLRIQSCAQAWSEDRAGVARHWMVAGPLFGRHL